MKAITGDKLHDFLINSRYSCKKYCLHNSTLLGITITVDPRIKFGLRKGDCYVKKLSFPKFFFGDHEFFSHRLGLIRLLILFTKNIKSMILEAAKVLKLILFSVRSLKSSTPTFSQIFPVTPTFIQDFDNRY